MSLLIFTSKSLKTLAITDQLKCLYTENTQLLVTDLALHNLHSEADLNAVKDFIDSGLITVIDTILMNKIEQYKESYLNIEECSIRNVIDTYAEKEEAVTILVDEDWDEMQLDNIQIISTSKFLKGNQVINTHTTKASLLSADDYKKSVKQSTFRESVKGLPVEESVKKASLFPPFERFDFKVISSGEDDRKNQEKDD